MRILILFFSLMWALPAFARQAPVYLDTINLEELESGQTHHIWLKMIDDGMSQPVSIPVVVVKGQQTHPVLGLTAAIHGNELNGLEIIRQLTEAVDPETMNGTIVAIPGLNAISIPLHQRRYFDDDDLNRLFPGKAAGTRAQQYVWAISQKVLPLFDYMIDMHTASFGRTNSLYVRGDVDDERIARMVELQDSDIILKSSGAASAGANSSDSRTMRAEAMLRGIPTITVEYGNPQVYQPDITRRGVTGIQNVLSWLEITGSDIQEVPNPVVCKKSYWIYVDTGGYLEVPVELSQFVQKDEVIGILRDPFGNVIKTYTAPEAGIVIGKSTNPVNMSGGRIIHLGIPED